jgi:hypothetical protein
MDWLGSLPQRWLLALLVVAVIVAAVMLVVAIVQGRELSFWPPKLGPRPAGTAGGEDGREKAVPPGSPFAGMWEHVWGWLAIEVEGKHARGIFLDRNGRSYWLQGSIDGDRLDYDATRYERNVPEDGAGGFLELRDRGRALEGTWRNADGSLVSQAARRLRWPAPA